MKIGLINNLYKPYNKGGAERIVELLADELRQLGYTVFIITTRPTSKKDNEEPGVYYLKSKYSDLNHLSYVARLIWQIGNLININKYFQILNILKTEKPDLVISHNLMGLGLLAPRAINNSGARQIQVLHDIQLLHPSGLMYFSHEKLINSVFARIYQCITGLMFPENANIVSPSKWLLDLHVAHGLFKNNNRSVITNPLMIKDRDTSVKKNNSFLIAGQVEYHKGVDLFVEAASHFPEYDFLVAGSGSYKNLITETDNLRLIGQKTSVEISKLLSESLAVIIPSRCYENSPTIIYEAASVGTPSIAASIGGIPELIERFGGLLFKPDNSDSLIKTITEFLNSGVTLKPLPAPENYAEKLLRL